MNVAVDNNYCSQLVSSYQRKLTETLREHQKLSHRLLERPEETLEIKSAQLEIQKEIIRISKEQKIITDIMRSHNLELRLELKADHSQLPTAKKAGLKGTSDGHHLRSGNFMAPSPLIKPPILVKQKRIIRDVYESKSSATDSSEIDTPMGSPPSSNTIDDLKKFHAKRQVESKSSKLKRKKQMRHYSIIRAATELKKRQEEEPKKDPDEILDHLLRKYSEAPQEVDVNPVDNHPCFFSSQPEFLRTLGLITQDEFKEVTELAEKKRVERRRRKTANPKYTNGFTDPRTSERLRKKNSNEGSPLSESDLSVVCFDPYSPASSMISSSNEDNECSMCGKTEIDCNLSCVTCGLSYHADCIRVSGSKAKVPKLLLMCPKCVREATKSHLNVNNGDEATQSNKPKIAPKQKSLSEKSSKLRSQVRRQIIDKEETQVSAGEGIKMTRPRRGENTNSPVGSIAEPPPISSKRRRTAGRTVRDKRRRGRNDRAKSSKGTISDGMSMKRTMIEMAAAANIVMSSPIKHTEDEKDDPGEHTSEGVLVVTLDSSIESLEVVNSPEPNTIEETELGIAGNEFLEKGVETETADLVPGSPPTELDQMFDEEDPSYILMLISEQI